MDNSKQLYKNFFKVDEQTVLEMVTLYRQRVILFVNSYVHNIAAAEDIASDAFVKLIIKKARIKNAQHFKTYLFAVAKNTAKDYLRKIKRERAAAEDYADIIVDYIDAELDKNEDKRAVLKSIYCLSKDYQSVLLLHYYEDLPVGEICKVMGKNKKQIYNLLQRAKDALKPILAKEGINDER